MHRGVASLYLLQHRHHLRRTLQAHVVTLALPHAVLRRNAATASRCPLEQERLKVVKDRRRATWNADIQVQVAIADVPVAAAEKHQSTANVGCEPTARTAIIARTHPTVMGVTSPISIPASRSRVTSTSSYLPKQ